MKYANYLKFEFLKCLAFCLMLVFDNYLVQSKAYFLYVCMCVRVPLFFAPSHYCSHLLLAFFLSFFGTLSSTVYTYCNWQLAHRPLSVVVLY